MALRLIIQRRLTPHMGGLVCSGIPGRFAPDWVADLKRNQWPVWTGIHTLTPVQNSNYAQGEIIIEARRLVKETINLSTELSDIKASAKVKVIQKEEKGIPIQFDFRNEDFGDFRSQWGELEGKPYLLLISAKHSSLKRYLGPAPDFEGRDSIHFRAILAEIIAESVGRKSLSLETKHHSWMFQYASYKEDSLIAETVVSNLQKRIKEFLPIAHQIMIENSEL